MSTEILVPGLVDYYVVKNDKGEYLQDITTWLDNDIPLWTTDRERAWKYGSMVAWHDAGVYGGKVYAIITQPQAVLIAVDE